MTKPEGQMKKDFYELGLCHGRVSGVWRDRACPNRAKVVCRLMAAHVELERLRAQKGGGE